LMMSIYREPSEWMDVDKLPESWENWWVKMPKSCANQRRSVN
jgi:hypothetical protein